MKGRAVRCLQHGATRARAMLASTGTSAFRLSTVASTRSTAPLGHIRHHDDTRKLSTGAAAAWSDDGPCGNAEDRFAHTAAVPAAATAAAFSARGRRQAARPAPVAPPLSAMSRAETQTLDFDLGDETPDLAADVGGGPGPRTPRSKQRFDPLKALYSVGQGSGVRSAKSKMILLGVASFPQSIRP